jgi:hypothetical protein
MSRWYRAYAGTIKDDKLAEAAVVAGCSRSVVIATWHAILESAAETASGGRFDTTPRRVAASLGEHASVIEAVFVAMQEIGLLSGSEIPAWKRRQYESDTSTERSRKYRATLRNVDATAMQRCATPPYTETETDTKSDTERKIDNPISLSKAAREIEPHHPVAKPFPSDGSIRYGDFAEISRKAKPGIDPDVVAQAFRRFCKGADPPIPFDDPRIAKRFEGFAKSHRITGH